MKSLVKKWFFSENASIHDRALVPPILPFLLAFIAGLLGNVAKFFIAPYLACAIALILAIFSYTVQQKTTQKTGHKYSYCCLYSDPHNGSRFSNSEFFVETTRPDAIVFSSGYLNRMKHPHSETLNLYKNSGVKIYRTDFNGALQIISKGQKYSIHTHEGL